MFGYVHVDSIVRHANYFCITRKKEEDDKEETKTKKKTYLKMVGQY